MKLEGVAPDRLAPVTGQHKGMFGEGAQILGPAQSKPTRDPPSPQPWSSGLTRPPGSRLPAWTQTAAPGLCRAGGLLHRHRDSTVSGERKLPREAGTPLSARLSKQQGVPRSLPFWATSRQAPGASRVGGGSEMAPIPELPPGHLHQQAGPPQGPKGFPPDLPHESLAHPDPWDPATMGGDTQS